MLLHITLNTGARRPIEQGDTPPQGMAWAAPYLRTGTHSPWLARGSLAPGLPEADINLSCVVTPQTMIASLQRPESEQPSIDLIYFGITRPDADPVQATEIWRALNARVEGSRTGQPIDPDTPPPSPWLAVVFMPALVAASTIPQSNLLIGAIKIMAWSYTTCDAAIIAVADDSKPAPPRSGAEMRNLLRQAGQALYGLRWQSDLARDLDVGDRRIRAWMTGERPIPVNLTADMIRLLEARANTIREALAALRGD